VDDEESNREFKFSIGFYAAPFRDCYRHRLQNSCRPVLRMSILITGGTKGIGLAIAKRFAKPETEIFLNYLKDDDAAEAARSVLLETKAKVRLIRSDVGTPVGARLVMEKVAASTDRLDQLVHCGVRVLAGPMLKMDPVALTSAINLNGTSLIYLVQAARPLLRRGSSVFFISSAGSRIIVPGYGAVGAAKALAETLVRYLALELAPDGIRINCVAPGTLDTQAVRQLFGEETDRFLDDEASNNPSGRNITHKDYTALIEFLAGPDAEMIQGQVFFVNGGRHLPA
jgi:enoyl-[acyl-carrier protein] reductase III